MILEKKEGQWPNQSERRKEADAALASADCAALHRLYYVAEANVTAAMDLVAVTTGRPTSDAALAVQAMRDVALMAIQLARDVALTRSAETSEP